MDKVNKRILSGVQPSGDLHLGNYLGAIKNFVYYHNPMHPYIFHEENRFPELGNIEKFEKERNSELNLLKLNKDYHKNIPHIVKFSGGRSSGALLFSMLKNGMLKANRGDVIIFNNPIFDISCQ